MKKYLTFIICILVIIISYILLFNNPKSYEKEYTFNEFNIVESYDKKSKIYTFILTKEDYTYNFSLERKYTTKRKLISNIDTFEDENVSCVEITVFKETLVPKCIVNNELVDAYTAGWDRFTNPESKLINQKNNIDIYNADYEYYIWNNYGITDVLTGKKYNFLNKEIYSVSLYYQFAQYLIFPDFDSSREFNKFYIFDREKKKITEWEVDYNISFDSYFMGDDNKAIYLFDRKNKIQYKLNISRKKISIVSDVDGGTIYKNGKWEDIPLSNLVYDNIEFTKYNYYNYSLDNSKLYLSLGNINDYMRISDPISSIIYQKDEYVIYLKGTDLFVYSPKEGNTKLLSYFEWNFSYLNKIYIFINN